MYPYVYNTHKCFASVVRTCRRFISMLICMHTPIFLHMYVCFYPPAKRVKVQRCIDTRTHTHMDTYIHIHTPTSKNHKTTAPFLCSNVYKKNMHTHVYLLCQNHENTAQCFTVCFLLVLARWPKTPMRSTALCYLHTSEHTYVYICPPAKSMKTRRHFHHIFFPRSRPVAWFLPRLYV